MWLTVINTALALLQKIAPGAAPDIVITIVDQLEALVPAVVQEAKDLVPTLKNVITTLRGNADTPVEQMDRLDVIDAKIDADYNAAHQAAQAEDAAAEQATSQTGE